MSAALQRMTSFLVAHSDKSIHLAIGAIIAYAVFGFCMLALPLTPAFGALAGLVAAITAGVGKEVYDKISKTGTPSWRDAALTIVGGLLVATPIWIVWLR